ncbi:hypothetical protein GGS23DRAFT_619723 [Durotheca rogersii]|uniref:uncharacterized protein n=1 Tax=Durotheca rogersii TaxID=419775 RepID=UPI00221FD315|nr:uncharacterized protein GGS23DRAFT_619723 [Durotheca rogersii]KAI5855014.1 hypothetical protein GGS23DRAFT_619723 [Durotheca rogersii]
MAPTGGQNSSTGMSGNVNTSDFQVAASNSTLNTWFGGRQPSWLTDAKPVKPTPRPPKPPGQTLQSNIPTRLATTHQPASAPVSTPASTSTSTPGPLGPLRPDHQRPSVQMHSSVPADDTVLPSPAPSDEPSPDGASLEPQNPRPTVVADLALDASIDTQQDEPTRSRASTAYERARSRQGSEASSVPTASTPTNMALNTPPTPNLPSFDPATTAQDQPELPPSKRRRLTECLARNPSLQFFELFDPARSLRAYLDSIGGDRNLDIHVERPRYHLMVEACSEGDLFFIALHQLFCSWTSCRPDVHQICGEGGYNLADVDNGFELMGSILKSNAKLRPECLGWFTRFPAPLNTIVKNPVYAMAVRQVLDFLVCISHKWMAVHQEHQLNNFPLLVKELLDSFSLYSSILQTIMFRASRRSLGIADGQIATRMEKVFRSDQNIHRNTEGNFVRRPPSAAYHNYNVSLVKAYRAIIAEARRAEGVHQASQQPLHGSPPVPQQNSYMRMNPGETPQVAPSLDPAVRVRPVTIPPSSSSYFLPSYFAPGPVAGNQFAFSGSLLNSPLNPLSPATADTTFTHPSAGAQLMMPPEPTLPSGTANAIVAPHALFPPSANVNGRMQLSQPSSLTPPLPRIPQLQHQFPARQPSQQATAYAATSSPRPSPIPAGRHHSPHSIYSTRMAQPGLQSARGRPLAPQRAANPVNGVPIDGRFSPNPAAMNVSLTPHTAHLVNRIQVSQIRPRAIPNPQARYRPPQSDPDRIIPPRGLRISIQEYPHTPYDKRSLENALHQVHLRSPKRLPRTVDSTPPERYYQAVKCFALPPVGIPPQPYLHKLKFVVSEVDHAKITREETVPGESLPVNLFSNGSLRIRIRCCHWKGPSTPFSESAWVTTETSWPEHIFMELNGRSLAIMRKAHHSKDLPVEVSSVVVPGENTLSVFIPSRGLTSTLEPYIAVEIVEVLSHSAALRLVTTGATIPPSATREVIRNRLSRPSGETTDDDELAIINYLPIDLADPFSRLIFDVPVRGQSCTHLECFDLETWLNTRLGKKSCHCNVNSECKDCPKEPSFVDKWKCPLCNGDARPYCLRVDGFLAEVRTRLEHEGKLHTKSILVLADGSWKPKEEPTGEESDAESDEERGALPEKKPTRSSTTPRQRERPPIEVIELDDD